MPPPVGQAALRAISAFSPTNITCGANDSAGWRRRSTLVRHFLPGMLLSLWLSNNAECRVSHRFIHCDTPTALGGTGVSPAPGKARARGPWHPHETFDAEGRLKIVRRFIAGLQSAICYLRPGGPPNHARFISAVPSGLIVQDGCILRPGSKLLSYCRRPLRDQDLLRITSHIGRKT